MDGVLHRIPVHPYDLIADLEARKNNQQTKSKIVRRNERERTVFGLKNRSRMYNSRIQYEMYTLNLEFTLNPFL